MGRAGYRQNKYLHLMAEIWQQYDEKKLRGDHLFPKLSRWYFSTAGSRMQPAFFIIGVQKGGTTSLAQYLLQHPKVVKPQRKDIYFFNNQVNYHKGISWYRAHFAHRLYQRLHGIRKGVKDTVTFDATPNYFPVMAAAPRIKTHYPDTKLILLLRNPVERAWSNYRMSRWHGFEPLSFEEALQYEDMRVAEETEKEKNPDYHSYVMQRLAYRTNGIYVRYLREWQKHFSPGQMLILRSEDLFEKPAEIFRQVTDFIGLPAYENVAFENFNKGKIEKEMDPQTRKELARFYEPYNRELYQLISRDMHWE